MVLGRRVDRRRAGGVRGPTSSSAISSLRQGQQRRFAGARASVTTGCPCLPSKVIVSGQVLARGRDAVASDWRWSGRVWQRLAVRTFMGQLLSGANRTVLRRLAGHRKARCHPGVYCRNPAIRNSEQGEKMDPGHKDLDDKLLSATACGRPRRTACPRRRPAAAGGLDAASRAGCSDRIAGSAGADNLLTGL